VSRDVIKQAVEDAMKPRFDEIAKKIDDGLAKIDEDVNGLKKYSKKSRKDLDMSVASSTRGIFWRDVPSEIIK